jgi:hypothetical protein
MAFGDVLTAAITRWTSIFLGISAVVGPLWQFLGPVIVPILRATWAVIETIFLLAINAITGVFRIFAAVLRGDWKGAWTSLIETARRSWTLLFGMFGTIGIQIGTAVAAWATILYNAGLGLMRALTAGITAGVQWVIDKVKGVMQSVRNLLPGSDAREGPLSDLTASGMGLMAALARGMTMGAGAPLAAVAGMAGGIDGMLSGAGGALDIMPNLGAVDASALSGRMGQIDASLSGAALSGDTRYAGEVRVWVDGGNIRAEMVDVARGVQRVESAQGWSSARQGA